MKKINNDLEKVFLTHGLILHIVKIYSRNMILKLSVLLDKIHMYYNLRMFFQKYRYRNI